MRQRNIAILILSIIAINTIGRHLSLLWIPAYDIGDTICWAIMIVIGAIIIPRTTIIIAVTILTNLILLNTLYNIWVYYYDTCNAILWFTSFFIIWRKMKEKEIVTITALAVWLTFYNLLDELFFDPTAYKCNEYLLSLFITLCILDKARYRWKHHNSINKTHANKISHINHRTNTGSTKHNIC